MKILIKIINIFSAVLYAVMSLIIIIVLAIASIISPVLVGVGVFYVSNGFSFIPFKGVFTLFLLFGLLGTITMIYQLISSITILFRRPDGYQTDNYKILKIIDDTAKDLNVKRFDKILIDTGNEFATAYIANKRYLIIGILPLKYLTINELKAIIAHEYGHYHNGAMYTNRVHYRIWKHFEYYYFSIMNTFAFSEKLMKKTISKNFGSGMYLTTLIFIPYLWIFKVYLSIFDKIFKDSDYEYYCDSISYSYIGKNIFQSALQKMADLSLAKSLLNNENTEHLDYFYKIDKKYQFLINENPEFRKKYALMKSDSHPSLVSRIMAAEKSFFKKDETSFLFLDTEIRLILQSVNDYYKTH